MKNENNKTRVMPNGTAGEFQSDSKQETLNEKNKVNKITMEYNRNQVLEIVKNNTNFQETKDYNGLIGVSQEKNPKTRAKGKKVINFYFFGNDAITLSGGNKAQAEMNDGAKKNNYEQNE